MRRLGLEDRVIVRERVNDIEDYLQAADLGLFTSDTESFCLSILEAMCFACPSVARRVGGIPEVIEDGKTGLLVSSGDADALARSVEMFDPRPNPPVCAGPRSTRPRPRTVFRGGHRATLRSALSPGMPAWSKSRLIIAQNFWAWSQAMAWPDQSSVMPKPCLPMGSRR